MVTGVITQNVDLLHTKAGSRTVINLHGTYAQVVCLDCGHTMTRAALAEQLEAANPGFTERAERGRRASRWHPTPTRWSPTPTSFRFVDCPRCGGMLKPDIVYFGESVPKDGCRPGLFTGRRRRGPAGRGLVADGVLRLPVRPARRRRRMPVAIINRGPTRGDDLATVKVDAGCSPLLALLADELTGRRPLWSERLPPWSRQSKQ